MTDIAKRKPRKPKKPLDLKDARPSVERRKLSALELRTRGYSLEAIANALNSTPSTISADINKELKFQAEMRKASADGLLEQELLRLDRIIVGLWPKAFGDDRIIVEVPDNIDELAAEAAEAPKLSKDAIELMLKTIDMRAKLLKMYSPETAATRAPLPWTDDF